MNGFVRIGVDFDNTIANYDGLFVQAARERGWVSAGFEGTKKQLRDAVRRLNDGEIKWQILQAEVYGPRMQDAVLFPGVLEFFKAAHRRGSSLFVVSHKTRFANYAETKVDLREAALRWMEAKAFFAEDGAGLARTNIFFADTRDEKIAKIIALDCAVFIDDLEEVFAHPAFPGHVRRVLFTSGNERIEGDGAIIAQETWTGISQHIFGDADSSAASHVPDVVRIAADLAGVPIRSVDPARTGGNNRLFRVRPIDGPYLALKQYPRQPSDPRDRLATEFGALQFMRQAGMTQIPAPLASDPVAGFALYDWIDGQPPASSVSAVDEAIAFVSELRELDGRQGASTLPAASEACFSPATIVAQVERRLSALRTVATSHPELDAFLAGPFATVAGNTINRTKELCRRNHVNFDASIDPSVCCLSPSDFGFHNALQRPDGRIIFLDFEYFGWDDPVKLTSDFILHPGMNLPAGLALHFRKGMIRLFGGERDFETRLRACLPLYALRWTMILLNEFLPDRWARKVAAGLEMERGKVLDQQLDKAQAMLMKAEAVDISA